MNHSCLVLPPPSFDGFSFCPHLCEMVGGCRLGTLDFVPSKFKARFGNRQIINIDCASLICYVLDLFSPTRVEGKVTRIASQKVVTMFNPFFAVLCSRCSRHALISPRQTLQDKISVDQPTPNAALKFYHSFTGTLYFRIR